MGSVINKYELERRKAIRNIKIADHMLTITYPLINDPKLLVAVMENTFLSMTQAMATLLYYERLYKRIPPFYNNFESKFNMFKERCVRKHNLDPSYLLMMQSLKEFLIDHRKSPMEFSRSGKFVVCNDSYKMKTISIVEMKKNVERAKVFISQVFYIIQKYKNG
jgi:hypothetical protein